MGVSQLAEACRIHSSLVPAWRWRQNPAILPDLQPPSSWYQRTVYPRYGQCVSNDNTSNTQIGMHAVVASCTQIQVWQWQMIPRAHTHAHTHTHTRARAHTHTHTHARTHTHTHTYLSTTWRGSCFLTSGIAKYCRPKHILENKSSWHLHRKNASSRIKGTYKQTNSMTACY